MEDGLESHVNDIQLPEPVKNGEVDSSMANFPEGTVTEAKDDKKSSDSPKVNGDYCQEYEETNNSLYQDSYSSESDALVIDESVPKKKKGKGKSNKKNKEVIRRMSEKENEIVSSPSECREKDSSVEEKIVELKKDLFSSDQSSNLTAQKPCDDLSVENQIIPSDDKQTSNIFNENSEIVDAVVSKTRSDCDHSVVDSETNCAQDLLTHSNPYFNESLFELSQLHHSNEETTTDNPSNILNSKEINSSCNKGSKRFKPKPKLKEYAQYLGLQPAVQFKCPKCGKSGFESLHILQDHFLQCNAVQILEKATENENISGFKLTRKVFLCSACGTYYENWNLYMHMLEYHRRYICLYCLGMFSVLEDLCQHIQSRHNLEPGVKNSLEDFYNTYTEPCYVVCCECNRQFNEGDNFFYHNCIPQKSATKNKSKLIKQVIAPENHITGDSIMVSSETLSKVSEVTNHSEKKIEGNLEDELINSDTKENEVLQVDSDKQNLIDNETSKQSVSDFSENADESSSSIKDRFPTTEDQDTNNKEDFSHSVNKDTCSDNSLEGEQDSLDSTKISEGIVDNHNSTENTMDGIEENFDNQDVKQSEEPEIETRKVPKLSLKLPKPKPFSDPEDSDESDKHEMEIDNIESENENDPEKSDSELLPADKDQAVTEKDTSASEVQYPVADSDIPIVEIELDLSLDKMDIRILLQKCLQATAATCIYCNHARRIAVNGKQLGLHAIAEHRYSAINKSITAEELIPDSFNSRIKECFEQLQEVFFNLDSSASDEAVTFSHVFECFQCHYSTTVHKELYLHNRKFHSKNLLLCIMCKSNFYSYSELICHLCPGVYILDYNLQFRCCMCVSDDLPSSFRLMVHLRKRHNVCDVCLEMCHSQYKLSNHVWKHKLHHFCYRCGIAYRNKPDITRHLFWKHGTESVLCKKCLQKKWPHVYHFCVPPAAFTCEECNLVFSRAVSLKVHKRIHTEEKKHACTWEDCTEAFISKKLMEKHLKRHTEPPEEEKVEEEIKEEPKDIENVTEQVKEEVDKDSEDSAKSVKPKVDVYDLPELNLSESDSSDSEPEPEKPEQTTTVKDPIDESKIDNIIEDQNVLKEDSIQKSPTNVTESQVQEKFEDLQQQAVVDDASSSVMQNIWDNFKNYQASKEKLDHMLIGEFDTKPDEPYVPDIPIPMVEEELTWQVALRDHDYCAEQGKDTDTIIEVKPALESAERVDHDYCFQSESDKTEQPKGTEAVKDIPQIVEQKSPAQKRSSSSSSSSDSDSSCACGSSCSCSDSSSDSSSSSSDSSNSDSSAEGGTKKQQRRLKKKERKNAKKEAPKESEAKVDTVTVDQPVVAVETPINESDLETTESETDEEFYDREPQMFAKKILEEKRAQLLAEMGPNMVPNGSFIESTSRPPTPPAGTIEEEEQQPKKKKKTKKRKKKKSDKRVPLEQRTYSSTLIVDSNPPQISTPSYYQQFHQIERQSPTVAPITLSLSRNSPVPQTPPINTSIEMPVLARQDSTASDTSLRASKRRRVPNKFYGYSSDEENDKPKRSKMELNKTIPAPASPMLVPPITIKTGPSPMTLPPKPPVVEPLTLRLPRPTHPPNDFRVQRRPSIPPIRLFKPKIPIASSRDESATDSNDSDMDEPAEASDGPPKPQQPQLYCYCRCPYDEVSEMIGCDSNDCEIEWFHFECVGIMVPPKGQWFCPDCRKKKQQQRRDILT